MIQIKDHEDYIFDGAMLQPCLSLFIDTVLTKREQVIYMSSPCQLYSDSSITTVDVQYMFVYLSMFTCSICLSTSSIC